MATAPVFESLEGRWLLYAPFDQDGLGAVAIPQIPPAVPAVPAGAVPAGAPNLAGVRLLLVDATNTPLDEVVVGQRVYVRFEYTTTDLGRSRPAPGPAR
jgi:hypothetical protein